MKPVAPATKTRTLQSLLSRSALVAQCGPPLVEESPPGAVLEQHQLKEPGVPLEEGGFARREIEVPHADEAVVEPEGAHAGEVLVEPLAPGAQGERVVDAAVLGVIQRHRGGPRQRLLDLA